MTGRGRLLPMVALALLAGCTPDSDEDAQSNAVADVRQAQAAPLPEPAPAPVPPAPALSPALSNAVVAVKDLRPADRATLAMDRNAAHPLDLPPSEDAAPLAPFPREVTAFMVDRDGCDHFRGEEPYDAERRVFLKENIAELCTGTDARLAVLKQRYARESTVMAALDQYEDRIEGKAP